MRLTRQFEAKMSKSSEIITWQDLKRGDLVIWKAYGKEWDRVCLLMVLKKVFQKEGSNCNFFKFIYLRHGRDKGRFGQIVEFYDDGKFEVIRNGKRIPIRHHHKQIK
tara:strand:- start:869 stop:1189 length:321 start_codon:yes stop_codon:yes gene_type:complete